MKDLISVNKAFGESFEIFKKDPITLSSIAIVPPVVGWVLQRLVTNYNLSFATWISPLITFYFSLVMVLLVFSIARDEKRVLPRIFKDSIKIYLPFLWTSVLMLFITIFGFLLLVIPGIIFSVWFTPVSYIVVCDKIGGFKALGRSQDLVKGYFWPVFILSIPYLVLLAVDVVFFQVAPRFWGFSREQLDIISVFVSVLFFFWAIYTYVIYAHLVEAKKS